MDVDAGKVEIELLSSPDDCAALAATLADVWGFSQSTALASPDTLKAMAHSGCYVVGVRVEDLLIGGGFGWPTRVGDEWRLHSHVIGLLDGYRAFGLGARIKYHQRDFARAGGLDAIEWTYDPLHAANAHFNLVKLGATVLSFHHDFYGELKDVFSAGLGSDRFLVRWGLDDSPLAADSHDRELILDLGDDGSPVVNHPSASRVAARIPANIVDMRAADKPGALEWRDAFAATVGAELEAGSRVVGMTADLGYLIDR